jgi:hypothetical protein
MNIFNLIYPQTTFFLAAFFLSTNLFVPRAVHYYFLQKQTKNAMHFSLCVGFGFLAFSFLLAIYLRFLSLIFTLV